jgi:hypothetical protein
MYAAVLKKTHSDTGIAVMLTSNNNNKKKKSTPISGQQPDRYKKLLQLYLQKLAFHCDVILK